MAGRRNSKNTKGAEIAKLILEKYEPESKEDVENALKDIFGPMFEDVL